MYTIIVSKELKEACPVFAGAAIYAEVKNTSYCCLLYTSPSPRD